MEAFSAVSWNAQAFLDLFAGTIPDFPDIEQDGTKKLQ